MDREEAAIVHADHWGDPMASWDFRRDELKDSSSCFTCGSPDPAIIEGRFCCDCPDRNAFLRAREDRLTREIVRG